MTTRATPPGLADCAREPIHVPGRIQPHGLLFVLDEPGLTIRHVGANVADHLGVEAAAVIGTPLAELVAPAAFEEARARLLSADVRESGPWRLEMKGRAGGTVAYAAHGHRHDGRLILELEAPGGEAADAESRSMSGVRRAMARLEGARSLRDLCQAAAAEVQALTGFERALVYRFDADWHGEVVAEVVAEGLEPFLGLHFPSSDIPEQARRLYVANRSRLIADAEAAPAPLVPGLDPASGRPVDLGMAALRAVSPVHIQYMKNMGTRTSMSFSLLRDGRLWGLLSCMNHRSTLYAPPSVRGACELLATLASTQLAAKEDGEGYEYGVRLQAVRDRLIRRMGEEPNLAAALLGGGGSDILELTGAGGAAVVQDGAIETVGEAPGRARIESLVHWLRGQPEGEFFQTDSLARLFPEAMAYKDCASGLLAATTARAQGRYVLWFRPEVIRTVAWGGDPRKPYGPGGSLSPRASFARWEEEVRLRSAPWLPAEVAAASGLRDAIVAVVVARAEELARLNAELERSNRDLDAFAFSASHDLKEPLRGIHHYASFLLEDYADRLDAEGVERLESLGRLSRRMESLVESMFRYSRLGRSRLDREEVDLNTLTAEVVELHRVTLDEGGATVTVPRTLPAARCDRDQVAQLLGNLITNAVKYNDKPRKAIEVGYREPVDRDGDGPARSGLEFYVRDDGIGIPEKHHQAVFRLFKRLHGRDKFGGGTGAGLAFSKRIVERHGGSIWVESGPGGGTTFVFTLGDQGEGACDRTN
ncbi:ATP-binding protein [Paludisphaera sp.]|uniref:ATP-binding protein n=1 Tax=Paludisphaera sp. TaxID=2017432 RepID=UPI00301D9EA1